MRLFIIILRYIVQLDKIDEARQAHLEFLDIYYKSGNFIASGRQEPATGGVIIARASSRDELMNIITKDPFYLKRLAEYNIYNFQPNKYSSDAEFFKQFAK